MPIQIEPVKSTKLPDWTEDELLLVLELYFRFGTPLDGRHSAVGELSKTLDSLGRLWLDRIYQPLRSPSHVSAIVDMYATLDRGAQNSESLDGASLSMRVFETYKTHRIELSAEVQRIRHAIEQGRPHKRWILSLSRDNRSEQIEPNFPVFIRDFDVARDDWVIIVHPTETVQSEFLCEKAVVSNVYPGLEKERIADLSIDSSRPFSIEKHQSKELKPFLRKSRYSQLHLISWEFWNQNFESLNFEVRIEPETKLHHRRSIEQLACDIWKQLVCVPPSESITYQELGNRIGMDKRFLGKPLELIQQYCIVEKLPALTVLVVEKATGKPQKGFTACRPDEIPNEILKVCGYNWSQRVNPFEFALDGTTKKVLMKKLRAGKTSRSEVLRTVKDRGQQQELFKALLHESYSSSCAFCGLSYREALEAAHIVEWHQASDDERINPQNGLLLCSTHHKLFDKHILSLSVEHTIEVNDLSPSINRSSIDRDHVLDLEGRKIRLPKSNDDWPSHVFIRRRNQLKN